jgi:hypothetical protein
VTPGTFTYSSRNDSKQIVNRRVAGWSALNDMTGDQDLIDDLKKNKVAAIASLHGSGSKSSNTQRLCDHIDVQQ